MPPLGATQRAARLLGLVPWVVANDGPTVAEVCARFDLTPDELEREIELLAMVGVGDHGGDALVEAFIEEDRVCINYERWFTAPVRLNPIEALALVVGGRALLEVPGGDPSGALATALDKVATAMGFDEESFDVDLGGVTSDVLATLRAGLERHRRVEIDYYSSGRDAQAIRSVDLWSVRSERGEWYATGHCHLAGGRRTFRVDRIRSATLTDERFEPPDGSPGVSVFSPDPDDPLVVLALAPAGEWVARWHPHEGTELGADGRLLVSLRISEPVWLERLLMQLGGDAEVVEGPPDLRTAGSRAAARLLARYR